MEILNVENLTFKYPKCDREALSDVSFSVNAGDFIVLFGETGCGKTTLLRMLKRELSPAGEKSGSILYKGTELSGLDAKTAATEIGFVMQKPETQIVTDKVWHELAFGLESAGASKSAINRRISEMASYFGIGNWFLRDVSELSGGQKQLLNLASVMVTQPKLLLLDEPTSQLDPIAASEFISTLAKLNRELSLTIIISEHRLEDLFLAADKAIELKDGRLIAYGEPRSVAAGMDKSDSMEAAMPCAVRVCKALDADCEYPLTVKEGRAFIEKYGNETKELPAPERTSGEEALRFSRVFFRYGRELPDVLCDLDLSVKEGEIYCLLGDNASGKTTALSVAAGLLKAYSGKVEVFGKKISAYKSGELYKNCVAMLPQDVQTVFLHETIRDDLAEISEELSSLPFDVTPYLDKHPYDLSGGEQQLCALAKTLLLKPRLLLLDEPTKGVDAAAKRRVIEILRKLKSDGVTTLLVTHDVEFAASCADRCALFFNGSVAAVEDPETFFSENNFYTTAASRMSRGHYDRAVTADDVVKLCRINGRKPA
ncbi:MAG: ATP-binding cassette domain-containing protein [Clostridia bacterium]|nr:ATP-binding cassette domain-containing protein [Clostridia bacterium]